VTSHPRRVALDGPALLREEAVTAGLPEPQAVLDGGDRRCGELILALRAAIARLRAGEVLKLVCDDPGAREDLPAWCRMTGHRLLAGDGRTFYIARKEE
jgi:tRNA 2-thiouridine synthesizing protein A